MAKRGIETKMARLISKLPSAPVPATAPGPGASGPAARRSNRPSSAPAHELGAQGLQTKDLQRLAQAIPANAIARSLGVLGGVEVTVNWANGPGGSMGEAVLCPELRRNRDTAGRPPSAVCRACLEDHLKRSATAGIRTHQFVGACGLANAWGTLLVHRRIVVVVILQSRHAPDVERGKTSDPSYPVKKSKGVPSHGHAPADGAADSTRFAHSVTLVRLFLHDLKQTIATAFAQQELERARQVLRGYERQHRAEGNVPARSGAQSWMWAAKSNQRGMAALRRLIEELHHRYAEPLQLKSLAATVGMNASYLSALFSRTTGLNFQEYLNEVRVSKAKELLASQTMTIKEIAYAVGYPDPNSFRQRFKNRTGFPPTQWRAVV